MASLVERHDIGSVIIVTDPYHAKRASLIAQRSGIDVVGVAPVSDSVVGGVTSVRRHLVETAESRWAESLGSSRSVGEVKQGWWERGERYNPSVQWGVV